MGKLRDHRGSDARLVVGLKVLPQKPDDSAKQDVKKRYSEKVSEMFAYAIANELRNRGLNGTRPMSPGKSDLSGAERRMAGGIGAKKVDVTWATEEAGLLLGVSVKSINFRDKKTKNFQKNLANRRGDMLFESVTLHRRFPYSVLIGFFILDAAAATDGTGKRSHTFENAHDRLALFSGRDDPAGREEQFEKMYIVLLNTDDSDLGIRIYPVGEKEKAVTLDEVLDFAVEAVAKRNPDFYTYSNGMLIGTTGRRTVGLSEAGPDGADDQLLDDQVDGDD